MEYLHGGDIYTYEGMIDFSVNINPFGPDDKVLEAVQRAAAHIGEYPDSRCRKLRSALAGQHGIPEDMLIFGNGAAELIFSVVFAEHPRKALLTAPSFTEYAQALKAAGCEIVYHYLKEDDRFQLTEGYMEELTDDVDMIFLCTPDNPSGQVIDMPLLRRIVDRCGECGIRVVIDECFYEFLEHPEDILSVEAILDKPWVLLLRAFTKMHAVPGLRLGYGISSDRALLERMEGVTQPWNVSVAAQAAGLAALSSAGRAGMTRDYVARERRRMELELDRIGITYCPSAVNYILMYSDYDLSTLLKERGILIRDCSNYEGLKKGYYRTAVKTHDENTVLLKALQEICGQASRCRDKEETKHGEMHYDTRHNVQCGEEHTGRRPVQDIRPGRPEDGAI